MAPKVAALFLFALLAAAPAPSGAADDAAASRAEAGAAPWIARARDTRLAEDLGWLRLGHWRKGLGGWKSEVDGREFFLAPRGKTDPAAELAATLEGLFSPGPFADELADPFCRFPARVQFLAARLGLDPAALPPRKLPEAGGLPRARAARWRDARLLVLLPQQPLLLVRPHAAAARQGGRRARGQALRAPRLRRGLRRDGRHLQRHPLRGEGAVRPLQGRVQALRVLLQGPPVRRLRVARPVGVRPRVHAARRLRSSRATCGSSAGPGSRTGTSTRTAAITCSARSRLRRPGSISSRTSARPWSSPPTP